MSNRLVFRFKRRLVVVFTMGAALNGRDLLTDLVDEGSDELKTVMADAGWRYVVFELNKEICVRTLMDMVADILKEKGEMCELSVSSYSSDI